jgi:hypothetical protein
VRYIWYELHISGKARNTDFVAFQSGWTWQNITEKPWNARRSLNWDESGFICSPNFSKVCDGFLLIHGNAGISCREGRAPTNSRFSQVCCQMFESPARLMKEQRHHRAGGKPSVYTPSFAAIIASFVCLKMHSRRRSGGERTDNGSRKGMIVPYSHSYGTNHSFRPRFGGASA